MNCHLFHIVCLKLGKIETVNKNLFYGGNVDKSCAVFGDLSVRESYISRPSELTVLRACSQ